MLPRAALWAVLGGILLAVFTTYWYFPGADQSGGDDIHAGTQKPRTQQANGTGAEAKTDEPAGEAPVRIRRTGIIQFQPETATTVYVPAPGGILEKLSVRDGEVVEKGQVLARFRNLELETQLEEARAEHEVHEKKAQALTDQLNKTDDASEKKRLAIETAKAKAERDFNAQRVRALTDRMKGLELKAPHGGMVVGLPDKDEIGKQLEQDATQPLCSVGDPRRLRVLVPVTSAEYRLLKAAANANPEQSATISVPEKKDRTWRGKVGALPQAAAPEVPAQLSERNGGPVPVRPAPNPKVHVPAEEWYLVDVDLLDPDAALRPGTRAQVEIRF